ncbi:MAG: hypothetical protein JNL34_03825 [Anaerolineae bacterium]|nr:hypothetical protein [Anaerolineae bacterium]
MQNVMSGETHEAHPVAAGWSVSYGTLVAIGLFALALALRLIALDAIPMAVRESPDALAALRAVVPHTPGGSLTASSAAVFLAQASAFMTMGSSEFAARFVTALAGACLVLTPLLFQRKLGTSWAFAFGLALVFSPTLLLASRQSAPLIWALVLNAVGLWALMCYRETAHNGYALGGVTSLVAAALLTGWDGLILTVIVLIATFLALRERPEPADEPVEADRDEAETHRFPWVAAVLVPLGVVAVAATAFMLYPAGLNAVAAAVGGVAERFSPLGGPVLLHALLASVFYETAAWLLGLIGFGVLARRGLAGPAERFLIVWLGLGVLASLFFVTGPEQSLWVTVPLAGLAGRLLVELLRADDRPGAWIPYRARFIAALVTGALLLIFSLAFQSFARALAQAPAGQLSAAPVDATSVILMAVMALFAGVIAVLGTNLWDRHTVWCGVGLAFIVFGGFASLGSGWLASVHLAEDPTEPWHFTATDNDTILLSATLKQLADRQSGGLPELPIAVQGAQNGVLAWLVRDYRFARFVQDAREAAGAEVFLAETAGQPDLGGPFVGQSFTLTRTWSPRGLSLNEVPAWWGQHMMYPGARAATFDTLTQLWVRQDIYDGAGPGERG